MAKTTTGLALVGVLLLFSPSPQGSRFSKYKAVEAYQIRPGILMMPRYSDDGQVCEIGLQVEHYSTESIRLDPSMSRTDIDQIFDELVPNVERGPMAKNLGDLITRDGPGETENIDFENVSIQIYSHVLSKAKSKVVDLATVAAEAHWKNRKCQ